MKKFAYLDKGGVLHITVNEQTAKEYSKSGKVVETELPASGGYPVVADEEILVYSETKMKLEATSPETLDATMYPQLAELYKQCR